MKINNDFELRDICGENIIIAHGLHNIDFTKVVRFNETATFLWHCMKDKAAFTVDDLAAALIDAYEVDPDTARADSAQLLTQWRDHGFLIEE